MNAITATEAIALDAQASAQHAAPAVVRPLPAMAVATSADHMLAMAIEKGLPPEMIREFLALRREIKAEQAQAAFHDAMAAFKQDCPTIFKRKRVGYETRDGDWVGYAHAELSDVTDVLGPAMAKQQLVFDWDILQEVQKVTVTCIITHVQGHTKKVAMSGPPDNSGKKNQNQQNCSTVTLLQRYTLLAASGMSTKGMDDDGAGSDPQNAAGTPPWKEDLPKFYAEEGFKKNLATWRDLIQQGKRTATEIIQTIEKKAPLSDDQKARLNAIHPA